MIEKVKRLKKFSLSTTTTNIEFNYSTIRSSKELAIVLKDIHKKEGNDFQEFFYCLFLNRSNKITGYYLASIGGVTGTVADPRIIIKAAALTDCCNMAICHNHPSGSVAPSRPDQSLTQKLKEACSFFDIALIDHIIISEKSHYSFAEEGIL